ncbi:MAG: tetratricopeptide repeat protein [Betaproteobacteria bacterium]|nr:tetratricopeptide repeat protein [Betaproteobacteria bacterium]
MKITARILPAVSAVMLLLAAGAAQGQAATDAERCASVTGNPDLAIQHCARAIESGRFSGEPLAKLHFSRGVEWAAKGDFDQAIADYDAALRLAPKFADALYNRATAWANKGDPDRAIADFDAALRLNPKDPAALGGRAVELTVKGDYTRAIADYDAALRLDPKAATAVFGRGRARFYNGDYGRAVSDLEQALKLEPNSYTSLWLYLARKRGNVANADEVLDSDTRAYRGGGWPAAVIVLYLGRTDAASVTAASTDSDAKTQREQRCEANFYVAQWHLLRGEQKRALSLLKEAQGGCPKEFLEYEGTLAELRRLQAR